MPTYPLRAYQKPIYESFVRYVYQLDNARIRNWIIVAARRSGKDFLSMEMLKLAALTKVGVYAYFMPTVLAAKEMLFKDTDEWTDLNKFEMHFGSLIEKKVEMPPAVWLKNGSRIVLGGMDDTRYRGRGLRGAVLSEAAWADARSLIYGTLKPMFASNNGFLIIQSTPQGKNSFLDLYQEAVRKHGKTHYAAFLPIDETRHMSAENLEETRQSYLEMYGKVQGQARYDQEFTCSFEADMVGQIYDQQLINNAVREKVSYNNEYKLWCSMDIGYKDNTALLIYQVIDRRWKILKSYENHLQPISHYIEKIEVMTSEYNTRPTLILPHDAKAVSLTSATSVQDEFEQHGYRTEALKPDSLIDGINGVRRELKSMDIDAVNCKDFVRALSQYRYKVDDDGELSALPHHDSSSHYADAVRYMCNAKHLVMPRDFILDDLPKDSRFFGPTRVSSR